MSSPKALVIGILISGRGSNMHAVAKAIHARELDASIGIVISDQANAPGIPLAQSLGLQTMIIEKSRFGTKVDYENAIIAALDAAHVKLVVLAGYMQLVGPTLLTRYRGKMVNIHPSLLPAFKGLHAQKQAFEYGVKITGCTVHFVNEDLDGGPIIDQEAVDVKPEDSLDTLSERILAAEHRLLPSTIQSLINKGEFHAQSPH